MYNQVGNLQIEDGVAGKGLLIRHLVLPNNLAGTEEILDFISQEISAKTYINLMDQYYPAYQADKYKKLNRRLVKEEFKTVIDFARKT